MANVKKKIKGTDNVLVAFVVENGLAIGKKNSGDYCCNAVVYLEGNEDGTTTLHINEDILKELNGKVEYTNFFD